MRATIRDIAQNLGLSHSTVSKVLNQRSDSFISAKTRQRVELEAKRLAYRPNHAARALVTGKTGLIGLGIGDYFQPYNMSVMAYVDNYLTQRGYRMMVQRFYEANHVIKEMDWSVDALIMLDHPEQVDAILFSMPRPFPIVSIGTYSYEMIDHVGLDLFSGAQQAMRHLLAQGYTRIHFVVNTWGNRIGEPRRDAYVESMNHNALEPEYLLLPNPARETAYLTLKKLLQERSFLLKKEKTALFCFNDEIAVGCYRALLEYGLRIPDDVGLVGCDNSPAVQYLECPLSSISYSIGELCSTALDFLEARIENETLSRQVGTVQSHFVSRKSTKEDY